MSVDPQFLPEIQRQISTLHVEAAKAYAQRLLSVSTLADMKSCVDPAAKLPYNCPL